MTGAQPTVHISYRDQDGKQQSELYTSSFRIGRGPECDVCIPDPVVSRKHVEVVFLADSWWLVDDGSANGTFVGGAMILDGLRPDEHPTHFSIGECVDMLGTIAAKRSFITHLTHNSEHHELQARLGDAVTVPWDGLEIEL